MGLEISDEALKKNIIEKGRNIDSIISLLKDLLDDGVSDQLKEGERVIRVVD
jgi:hypothetical protein